MTLAFTGQAKFLERNCAAFWEELCDRVPMDQPFRVQHVLGLKVLAPFSEQQRRVYARALLAHALETQEESDPHIVRCGHIYVLPSR